MLLTSLSEKLSGYNIGFVDSNVSLHGYGVSGDSLHLIGWLSSELKAVTACGHQNLSHYTIL